MQTYKMTKAETAAWKSRDSSIRISSRKETKARAISLVSKSEMVAVVSHDGTTLDFLVNS